VQLEFVTVVVNAVNGISSGSLLQRCEVLPRPYEYILLLSNFFVNNTETFQASQAVLSTSARNTR
jgi:hypothetical protein